MENVGMIKSKKRKELDILRVICAFCVVMIHSNEAVWIFSHDSWWVESTALFCLFYFAAPCFFMISGALLIDYSERYSTAVFFKKRAIKTLIPYLVWNLIGIVYLVLRNALDVDVVSIKTIFQMIATNNVIPAYWFFTAIFMMYLLTPILSFITEKKRKAVLEYIIFSMFILNFLLPFFSSIAEVAKPEIKMPIVTVCLYYVTGYYVDKYEIPKKFKKIIYFLGMLGFALLMLGTIITSYRAEMLIQTYMGYDNLPCYLYSVAVFCAFKQISVRVKTGQRGPISHSEGIISKWGGTFQKKRLEYI